MSDCVGIKWKTKNGINYPEGLEKMSFSHELSVEERYNLIEAYRLGYDEGKAERHNIPPERLTDVTGHWIDRSAGEYRCSNCGVKIGETDITDHPINSFNYCPNCGADMRKNNDEERSSFLCNTCAKYPCVFRDDRTESCDLYVKEPEPYTEEMDGE